MTSDCKIAILKGTAVCSLKCHLGMLQILFKNTSCHLTQKATPLHISQAVKQHSQMLLKLTLDVFIQPTFICVLPLLLTPQKTEFNFLESLIIFAFLRKPLPHETHLFSLHRRSFMSRRTRMLHFALTLTDTRFQL